VVHLLYDNRGRRVRWEQQLQQHFVEPLQEAVRRGDMQQQYGVSVSGVKRLKKAADLA
jgi:hypothetical protein